MIINQKNMTNLLSRKFKQTIETQKKTKISKVMKSFMRIQKVTKILSRIMKALKKIKMNIKRTMNKRKPRTVMKKQMRITKT